MPENVGDTQTTGASAPQTTTAGTSAQNDIETAQVITAGACLAVVDEYRLQRLNRVRALHRLSGLILDAAGEEDDDTRTKTYESYVKLIDDVDRGRAGNSGRASSETGDDANHGDDGDDTQQVLERSGGVRDRSSTPEPEKEAKRRKVDEALFGWKGHQQVARIFLSPEAKLTQKMVENYSNDIKITKGRLFAVVGIPPFPSEEWDNVLTGRFVDLDRVFAGSYSTYVDERRTEKLGEFEISTRSRVPDKRIRTANDWSRAWNRTARAIRFAFPHRASDLEDYGTHIDDCFGSTLHSAAELVIEYDRACRKFVAESRTHTFSNFSAFGGFERQYLGWNGARNDPGGRTGAGASTSAGTRSAKRGGQKDRDACRRFNAGTCPTAAGQCRYKHICSRCGSATHVVGDCTAH
ncbi:hypothetical protein B0H21DRAFT_686422 [Amylocystis lapponica]|nr:hypothetical protein B0H21DRAFT_686422 [Amylocystis lapponica]